MILLVIVLFATSIVVIKVTGDYMTQELVNEQMAALDVFSMRIAPILNESDAQMLFALCQQQNEQDAGRTLILSPSGTVIVDSHSLLNGHKIATAEIEDIITNNMDRSYGFHDLVSEDGQHTWVGYYASAIIYNGSRIGLVFRSCSIMSLMEQLDTLQLTIITYFFAVLIVIICLGFFMSDIISRPINKLKTALMRTSRGDFTVRAQVKGHDEIAQLAQTFNRMSQQLEDLDETRNRFISNASHELKTPLSAIKVLVETILLHDDSEMDPEMIRDFLSDVNGEVDRLNLIVQDLLTLVQMDSKGIVLNKTELSLAELVDETISRLMPLASQKGIALRAHYLDDPTVCVDRMRISQAIYNIVDNAIKYTDEGGHIDIRIDTENDDALLQVQDTGMGIPEKDLPYLFDRFYRVDKARSRSTGGTGLGLSIVREVIAMHDGDITVASKEQEGTTFSITLPLVQEEL